MEFTTVTKHFSQSHANMVGPTGAIISATYKDVEIYLYTREGETDPCAAEIVSGDLHAEVGLWFEGKELSDYDGVFCLPRELGEMLTDAGYVVPEVCFG